MIEKLYGKYVVICNICGEEMEEFDTWQDAADWENTEGSYGVCSDCL